MCRAMAFYRTSTFSTPQPQSLPSPSIVGRRLHKFRLRLTTASVCGTIDCSLRLPTLIPDTAPSSRCRARCLNLRSQTISAFPFRCLFPTPPASLRRRAQLHFNPVRNLRLLFRLVNVGLLLSELRSARSPYTRHVPPTHRGTADGISTHGNLSSHVRDATFNALSGREDYSLRARRHTSSLHCTADNSIAFQSTKPRVARSICRVKERVSRLRRHPFARGRFTGDSTPCHTLPKQVRPTSFLFVDCPSIASPASPIRSEQCRHNALSTLIVRPPRAPIFGQPKH